MKLATFRPRRPPYPFTRVETVVGARVVDLNYGYALTGNRALADAVAPPEMKALLGVDADAIGAAGRVVERATNAPKWHGLDAEPLTYGLDEDAVHAPIRLTREDSRGRQDYADQAAEGARGVAPHEDLLDECGSAQWAKSGTEGQRKGIAC